MAQTDLRVFALAEDPMTVAESSLQFAASVRSSNGSDLGMLGNMDPLSASSLSTCRSVDPIEPGRRMRKGRSCRTGPLCYIAASELEDQLLLARDLRLIRLEDHEQLEHQTTEIKRMLTVFVQRLTAEGCARAAASGRARGHEGSATLVSSLFS